MNPYIVPLQEASLAKMNAKEYKTSLELAKQVFTILSLEATDPTEFLRSLFSKLHQTLISLVPTKNSVKIPKILSEFQTSTSSITSTLKTVEFLKLLSDLTKSFRAVGKHSLAKKYLSKALTLCTAHSSTSGAKAEIYLNFCVLLSDANAHKQALAFARKACMHAQEELLNNLGGEVLPEQISLLGAAYYNLGVEEEHLGRKACAQKSYQKAHSFLTKQGSVDQALLKRVTAAVTEPKKLKRPHSAAFLGRRKPSECSENRSKDIVSIQPRIQTPKEQFTSRLEELKWKPIVYNSIVPLSSKRLKSSAYEETPGHFVAKLPEHSGFFPALLGARTTRAKALGSSVQFGTSQSSFSKRDSPEVSEIIPFEFSNYLLRTEVEYSKSDINKLVKLQAIVRGNRLRKKLKTQQKLVYRGKVCIDNEMYKVYVYERINGVVIVIENHLATYRLVTGKKNNYQGYLNRLTIHENKLVLKRPELGLRKVKQKISQISGEKYVVKYFTDDIYSLLVIKAKNPETKSVLYYSDLGLSILSEEELLRSIRNSIHPYLRVTDHSLTIHILHSGVKKLLLSSTSKHINTVNYTITIWKIDFDGLSRILIEIDDGTVSLHKHFSVAEIVEALGLSDRNEFYNDPHVLYLGIAKNESSLQLQKTDSVPIFVSHKLLMNYKYLIKLYRYTNEDEHELLISATGPDFPLLSPLNISEHSISEELHLKALHDEYSSIVDLLTVVDGQLAISMRKHQMHFDAKTASLRAIIRIQRLYRKHVSQQKLLMSQEKQQRELYRKLIKRSIKKLNNQFYLFSLFKTPDSLVIYGESQTDNTFSTKTIQNTNEFMSTDDIAALLDNIELIDGQLMMKYNRPLCRTYTKFIDPTPEILSHCHNFNRIILGQEYTISITSPTDNELQIILTPSLQGKILITTFSQETIQSKIGDYDIEKLLDCINIKGNQVILETNNKQFNRKQRRKTHKTHKEFEPSVILRSSIVQQGKICMIIVKVLAANPGELSENDLLIFEARQGADIRENREIEITIAEACECTGFDKHYLIPMGNFIIKHMLIVSPDTLAFDFSVSHFNPINYIIKLQAHIRGFLIRKRLRNTRELLFKKKTKITGEMFTLLVYKERKRIAVEALNNDELLIVYLKNDLFEGMNSIEQYIQKVIIPSLHIEISDGIKKLSGLEKLGKTDQATITKSLSLGIIGQMKTRKPSKRSTLAQPPQKEKSVFKALHGDTVVETTKTLSNTVYNVRILKREMGHVVQINSGPNQGLLYLPRNFIDSASKILDFLHLSENKKVLYLSANQTFERLSNETKYVSQRQALAITFSTDLGWFVNITFLRQPVSFTVQISQRDLNSEFTMTQEHEEDCFN